MACGRNNLTSAAAGHVPDLHVVVAVYPDHIGGVIAVEIPDPRDGPLSPQRANIAIETDQIAAVKQPCSAWPGAGARRGVGSAVAVEIPNRGNMPLQAHMAAWDADADE